MFPFKFCDILLFILRKKKTMCIDHYSRLYPRASIEQNVPVFHSIDVDPDSSWCSDPSPQKVKPFNI